MADKHSELYEINRLGAKPTKNSGRGYIEKGDGILYSMDEPAVTVDVKEGNKSVVLNKAMWNKITSDAKHNKGTYPLLKLVIGEKEPKDRLIVIPESFFMELYERWANEL